MEFTNYTRILHHYQGVEIVITQLMSLLTRYRRMQFKRFGYVKYWPRTRNASQHPKNLSTWAIDIYTQGGLLNCAKATEISDTELIKMLCKFTGVSFSQIKKPSNKTMVKIRTYTKNYAIKICHNAHQHQKLGTFPPINYSLGVR